MDAKHTLSLENNARLTVTGVKSVLSFNEKEVLIALENSKIFVYGTGLTVGKLDTANGSLTVDGYVNAIRYTKPHEKTAFFKKLVK